ncbi:MAG: DUF4258 domain-containing protein [Candidatus Eremiobacterota bacterium]
MDLTIVRQKLKEGKILIRDHAMMRFDQRGITIEEVEHVIMTGELIEDYPDDKPFPGCLISGYIRKDIVLYVVLALEEKIHIITAHWLDPEKWLDYKTRRDK